MAPVPPLTLQKIPPCLWREAEELFSSIIAAQKTFLLYDNMSGLDKTIAASKKFQKKLATKKKLYKKLYNSKQGLLKTRLDQLYLMMRLTAQILAAKVWRLAFVST